MTFKCLTKKCIQLNLNDYNAVQFGLWSKLPDLFGIKCVHGCCCTWNNSRWPGIRQVSSLLHIERRSSIQMSFFSGKIERNSFYMIIIYFVFLCLSIFNGCSDCEGAPVCFHAHDSLIEHAGPQAGW